MNFNPFAFLLLLCFFLLQLNGFGQANKDSLKSGFFSSRENYDYKYSYHGKGKYYIHAEEVRKEVFDRYIRKCDSIQKMTGIRKNMAFETVPEVEVVSEMAFYPGNVTFWGSGLNFTLPINMLFKDEKAKPWLNGFSLNWKALFGSDNSADFYLHSNAVTTIMSRIPLGTTTESSGNSVGVDLLTLFSIFIPEGITYHIPISEQFRINTFLNPFGADYWKNSMNNFGGGTPALDFGIKPGYVTTNKFTLGVTFGYKMVYADSYDRGLYGGISIGLQLY